MMQMSKTTGWRVRSRERGADADITTDYLTQIWAEFAFDTRKQRGDEYVGLFRLTSTGRVLLVKEA